MLATPISLNGDALVPTLSEQQFATTFGHAAIGMALCAPQGRFIQVNRALCQMLGYTEADMLTRTFQELTHPDDLDDLTDQGYVRKLLAGDIASFQLEKRYIHQRGHAVWALLTASSVRDAAGQPLHQIAQLQDITARKAQEAEIARLTRLYSALSHINQAIVRLTTRDALFQKVCESLVHHGGFTTAWMGWHDAQRQCLVPAAACGDTDGDLQVTTIPTGDHPIGRGPTGEAFQCGQPYICNDIRNDPRTVPWREITERRGLRACAAFPIRLADRVCGTLSVYMDAPHVLQDKEIALLSEAALDVSFALDTLARNAARQRAEDRHIASEASLAAAQALAHMGSWELDLATMTGTYSAEMFRLFYRNPTLGAPAFAEFAELVHPDDRHWFDEAMAYTLQAMAPYTLEYRTHPSLGPVRNLSATIQVVRDDSGQPLRTQGTTLDVTERKHAEAVLARMKAIVDSSDDAIISKDLNGVIESWNHGAEKIFGYRADEIIGSPILRLIPPERQEEEAYILSVIRQGGRVQHFETVRMRKDGTLIDVSVTSSPIRNVVGEIIGASKVARDITERKRAAEHLRLSEENLAITLQSIGDAVIATDTGTLITRMNPTAERLTGWLQQEALGLRLDEVFHIVNAQTRALATNPAMRVMESGETVALPNHTALLARDGREYQIFDSAAPIRDRNGHILGVVLVFSDVTEAYRVREALASTTALLERTGELAKVGGWELDLRTMQPNWTLETCRIHEVDPPVAPALDAIWDFYPPVSRAIMQAAVQRCMDSGESFDLELRLITAKGQPIWVRSQGVAEMENGKATKLLGAFHDITERKHAQTALQASLQEKEALLKEVHHRVKNNLQVINSLLRLETGRSTQPDTRTVLRDMQGRIQAMALLHESLYRTGTFASVDLGAYLKQMATQAFRTQAPSGGAVVQLELALEPVQAGMDQATPCGLLVNELISNCFKHAFPAGRGGTVRLELEAVAGTGQARLCVSDTGVGLPADFEERRTQSLGLQLVSDLAQQIKGALHIGPGPSFAVIFTLDRSSGKF